MIFEFHKNFKKRYRKLRRPEQEKFQERLKLFLQDPFNSILHNHPLKAEYKGYWSIDVTGDLRAHYERIDDHTVFFIIIGTHSELYG